MSAHHFFTNDVEHDPIVLTEEEAHHAARALRVRVGEAVTVSDGHGRIAHGVVIGTPTAKRVEIAVRERTSIPEPRPVVRILPAVPKGGKLDGVVQQLTEVGVDRITPWFADRSIARWDATKCLAQGRRLRSIALAAAKQSRRAWLPIVDDPGKISELPPASLVLHADAPVRLSDALREIKTPTMIGLICGPEGGLTDTERDQLIHAGATEASLGPIILRTETACVVASALVRYSFNLLG